MPNRLAITQITSTIANTETNSYGNLLPSLNIAFDATKDIVLRAAVSRTMTRASLSSLAPSKTYNMPGLQASIAIIQNASLCREASWTIQLADASQPRPAVFFSSAAYAAEDDPGAVLSVVCTERETASVIDWLAGRTSVDACGCELTIACPGDQVATAPPGAASYLVEFPDPTTGGTCTDAIVDCDPASGDAFAVGRTVRGKVTRLAAFGAFLELAPGIEGLLHISEMSAEKRVRTPGDLVKLGDELDVSILAADPGQRRISLSLKALSAKEDDVDPATRARWMEDRKPSAPADDAPAAGESAMALALRRARERAEAKGKGRG